MTRNDPLCRCGLQELSHLGGSPQWPRDHVGSLLYYNVPWLYCRFKVRNPNKYLVHEVMLAGSWWEKDDTEYTITQHLYTAQWQT